MIHLKWRTVNSKQMSLSMLNNTFVYLLSCFWFPYFSSLKVKGLGIVEQGECICDWHDVIFSLCNRGNCTTWKRVMFPGDRARSPAYYEWGMLGIQKPTSHFGDCRETCHKGWGWDDLEGSAKKYLECYLLLFKLFWQFVIRSDSGFKCPPGRALDAAPFSAGLALCNCSLSSFTARGQEWINVPATLPHFIYCFNQEYF